MKRLIAALLTLGLLAMCGCSSSSNKPVMYVVDGAYNLTPQEYIDLVNRALDEQEKDYPNIPDWEDAEISLKVGSFYTRLSMDTNSDGKITQIIYNWQITKDQNQVDAAYFMVGLTIGMISPEYMSDIIDELDMLATGKSSYINTSDMDGSHFHYTCSEYGKYNILHISPLSSSENSPNK